MNSSMSVGERRWASARRGGMTVLGKVAVPKPLNLPSQRLENHGLDPNVEIVPKGTLSWGSRPSSSGSNPWISSSLSPNGDGGTVSPSHLSGRPSSGGSGTRPSTAGSDRAHEPIPNAWSSNSRPSSSSGTLSSNQTSTSMRPRSAENRPNSSQLSRFADPVSKSSAAWGSSITAERLGGKSSKEDGFSLSSGDFPTLGSEKETSVKNVGSEDHGRPSSASGRILQAKEDTISQADVKHGTVNTWKPDGSRNPEEDIHPNVEKWQGDPHQYFNVNASQRFDAWRGPPVNGPAGVWYGGRPRGPAFGAPVAPGGFPMEPFPYYRPQIAPPPLAGSQPVPPPGAGPRGPHPKNGDLYRPQIPDAYARPGIPFRPGFYPGPPGPMAFEGYYGPPMGYCNSERDIPYMGMAAGPPVYNGYPAPAPDIGNSHGRPSGHGPTGKTLSEHVDTDHVEDTQGSKRVHLKNHNERDQRDEGENPGHKMLPDVPYPGKSYHPTIYTRKNEWGAEEDTEEAVFAKRSEKSSYSHEHRVHSADTTKVKSFEAMGNVKTVDDNRTNKSESVSSFPPDMPQLPLVSGKESSLLAATKNLDLMHKIDGLNAKHRVPDIQNDAPGAYNREEERSGSQVVDMKINNYTGGVSKTTGSFERTPVSVPHEVTVPVGDKPVQSIAPVSRRSYHGGQGRVENRGKGKFNSQDADGWRRKPLPTESSSVVTATNVESASNINLHGPIVIGETSENSMINLAGKTEGDSADTYDSTDIQAQRAKRKELAKQRALQLQKEEEERIREQKAKASAKLEELNRRTQAVEAVNQKVDKTQASSDIQGEQAESRMLGEPGLADLNFQEPGSNLVSNLDVTTVDRDSKANHAGESIEVSRNLPLEMQQTGLLESNVSRLPMHEDARDGSAKTGASQLNDGGFSRQKRPGSKQKQNNSLQKSLNEKSVSNVTSEAQTDHTQVSTMDITSHEGPSSEIKLSESNVPNTSITVVEPSAHQKRKSNRSGKNKHKLDEPPSDPTLPSEMSNVNAEKKSIETGESKDSLSKLGGSISTVIEPEGGVQAQEGHSSSPNEEYQSKGSHQWKSNLSRRLPRNHQGNRYMDKLHGGDTVVWAPVRTQDKGKGSVEESKKSIEEAANPMKVDNMAQNSSKGKRAEMERYVPKPVAKELAQQGSIPPSSSSISSSRSNESPGLEQSSIEINEEDGSHSKHKKEHGTWRQWGSTDSSHTKVVHGPSPASELTNDIQQSKELVQSVKSETNSATAETKAPSIVNTSDGYNMGNTTTAAPRKYPSGKDQGATGRGKRYMPRGSRSSGNNPDPDNTFSGEMDGSSIQSAAPDVNQTDRITVAKEQSFGERASSHWQPKAYSNSANNQHGNRTAGSESLTSEVNRLPKKDHPLQKVQVAPRHDKERGNKSQPQPAQSVNESNVVEESNVGYHQEFDREKKPALAKGRPYSPNQDPVGASKSALTANRDDQDERNIPSGSRRNGRQNNRSVRGHDSRGDWSSGHDHRPARQRQNVHYEYQPVDPFKGNKAEKVEEPRDGVDSIDQRHRERGQNHSKRGGGNFYRRQSGAAHIDSGRG